MNIQEKIKQQLAEDEIVLYMKGTRQFPMCGFSGKVIELLKACDVDFKTYNVLEDDALRQGVKTHANWPTIPQLYVKGEFIGGSDIITDLYEKGELAKILLQQQNA